jgi:hypothetical protein
VSLAERHIADGIEDGNEADDDMSSEEGDLEQGCELEDILFNNNDAENDGDDDNIDPRLLKKVIEDIMFNKNDADNDDDAYNIDPRHPQPIQQLGRGAKAVERSAP